METITFYKLQPTDKELIEQIAGWYFDEWAIPKDRTISRLTKHPNHDVLFQVVLKNGEDAIATGGLYNTVGLLADQPRFNIYGPWVALLYTRNSFRNQGLGAKLLSKIEEYALAMGYEKIYLYTFTAEILYKRNGWAPIERTNYKGHDTVIMVKIVQKHKQDNEKIMNPRH